MAALSDEEANTLANIAGLLNDEEAKTRIKEMQAAKVEYDKSLSQLRLQQAQNDKQIAEGNRLVREAATMTANAEARGRQLDLREAQMGDVARALEAEKASWGQVRARVDGEQKQLSIALAEREVAVKSRESAAEQAQQHVTYWANEVGQREARVTSVIAKLKAALAGLDG